MLNIGKALFISAFLLSATWAQAADCPRPTQAETVNVASVYDGDTVRLSDGRKVRLIGINTPEMGRDQRPDQPIARQARDQLRQLLRPHKNLLLQIGQQSHDRHGRLLGHLFLQDGRNLEALLLEQGLGFAISIAPNLSLRDCLNRAERQARELKLGVWSEPFFQPQSAQQLDQHSGGFGRYHGRISRIGKTKKGPFIEIDNKIFIPLRFKNPALWNQISSNNLLNKEIEVKGWLINRKLTKNQKTRGFLPFLLNINHPDSLILCPTDC